MDNGDRNVPPWGTGDDTQGASNGPPGNPWQGNGWQGNGFEAPPNGSGTPGPDQGRTPWGSQGSNQWGNQGPNPGPDDGVNQGPNQNPGASQSGMTSFPLAATGAYAAVRPPEPPPGQAPNGLPPAMTSFPLAATGAYQAVGQRADPDLSASGFRAAPQQGPGPAFGAGPFGHPGPVGPPGPPGPAPGGAGGGNRRRALLIGGSVIAVAGVAAGAIALTMGGGGKKQPDAAPATTASSPAHSVTPSAPGTQTPSAAPSSSASKASPPAAPPVADVLRWRLNDKPGSTTAVDASGRNRAGVLSGAAGFSTAHGGSVEFKGAANQIRGGQLQTKGPAINTAKSFTVSMWVDQTGFTTPTKYAAAFSQDGPTCFAFTFSYSLDSKTWSFVRSNADGANPVAVNAGASAPSPLNTWIKLTGVYDAQAGTIELFVNGLPQGGPVKAGSAPYAATGPFAIGRSWYGKYPSNPFKGYISDVQVFGRALSADEVKSIA